MKTGENSNEKIPSTHSKKILLACQQSEMLTLTSRLNIIYKIILKVILIYVYIKIYYREFIKINGQFRSV